MGHSHRSLEDSTAEGNEDSGSPAYGISEMNKDSISNWAKILSYDSLPKNLAVFCPCPENLHLLIKTQKANFFGRGKFKIA